MIELRVATVIFMYDPNHLLQTLQLGYFKSATYNVTRQLANSIGVGSPSDKQRLLTNVHEQGHQSRWSGS